MDNVIIYARVSSKEQESEGYSIPAQKKILQEYAYKNNYSISQQFTDIETAKKAGRTQFNKMIELLKENKTIKHILVEKTDRLLRNISDYALLDNLIEASHISIHLVKENVVLDRDSRSNEKFIFGIKALMAKNYVDNLSEETKKGMLEKAEQGIYPSVAPYGYLNVEENGRKVIAVDSQTAPFVKKVFELYTTGGYSLSTLRKKMIDDGMVYRSGKNFNKSTIEFILKNEFYTGVFYWKSRRYESASHEALIDKTLFRQVQDILINPNKSKSRKGLFPYTNLIRCGACGCMLTAEIKKEKYVYYHCTGSKGKCNQPYLKQEAIGLEFEKLLKSINISKDMQEIILQGLKDSFADKVEYHNNNVEQLEKQMQLLKKRIDQSYLDKLDKRISKDFWQTQSKKWINEKECLAVKLLSLQRADSNYLENANLILELSEKAAELFKRRNADQKRKLIQILTSNCSYNDGKLDLELKRVFGTIVKTVETGKWLPGQDSNLRPND